MEFVTSGTSDTCVKYFWVQVKLSELTQKIACEICQIQASVFTEQLE